MLSSTPAAPLVDSFGCTLISSTNDYLKYPCKGRIQIIERFLDGTLSCVFQVGEYLGGEFYADGGPVDAHAAEFIVSSFQVTPDKTIADLMKETVSQKSRRAIRRSRSA